MRSKATASSHKKYYYGPQYHPGLDRFTLQTIKEYVLCVAHQKNQWYISTSNKVCIGLNKQNVSE